ncbi:mitochondrial acyl carrier protein [Chamberlinius hualienensis]
MALLCLSSYNVYSYFFSRLFNGNLRYSVTSKTMDFNEHRIYTIPSCVVYNRTQSFTFAPVYMLYGVILVMIISKVLTAALVLIVSFCNVKSDEGNKTDAQTESYLKMLFMVFRHGARVPLTLLPNNSYNKEWEKQGLGELTNLGKREQLENGVYLRANKHYNKFIGPYYNFSEFYIQSTTVNRAVMSGETFTTGLFPPTGSQIWTNSCLGLNWQPIPVFTLIDANNPHDPNGVLINKLAEEAGNDPTIYKRNKEIIDAISNATGAPLNSTAIYSDALICQVYQGVTLPFGLEKYKNQLFPYSDDVFNYVIERYYPFTASGLLNDMVKRIELYNNKISAVKTNIYSLHDVHVAAFMAAVSELVGEPEFCGAAYLELYGPDETSNTDYVIVRYRRKLNSAIEQVDIKNCGYTCPYSQFLNIVKEVNDLSNSSPL